jgi:hypothetical protein
VTRAGDVKEVLTAELRLENAPLQATENIGIAVARGRMLSSVRPLMRQENSRRPVWEFADRVQITRSVLEALWKALVVPASSRRLLRHTLLPLTPTPSRSRSTYAAATGAFVDAAFDQQRPDDAGRDVFPFFSSGMNASFPVL